ncbi:393_t:CDS:10 [Funneliformis geosporum]|uniref:393_t:CDS:1 n=1 Tax=Funneliformis geosporum TaxID=1117311 RepID=A0A9W4X0L1_9GLOM|nr:393_t:CDS:10 [Funneliformis geosporum]
MRIRTPKANLPKNYEIEEVPVPRTIDEAFNSIKQGKQVRNVDGSEMTAEQINTWQETIREVEEIEDQIVNLNLELENENHSSARQAEIERTKRELQTRVIAALRIIVDKPLEYYEPFNHTYIPSAELKAKVLAKRVENPTIEELEYLFLVNDEFEAGGEKYFALNKETLEKYLEHEHYDSSIYLTPQFGSNVFCREFASLAAAQDFITNEKKQKSFEPIEEIKNVISKFNNLEIGEARKEKIKTIQSEVYLKLVGNLTNLLRASGLNRNILAAENRNFEGAITEDISTKKNENYFTNFTKIFTEKTGKGRSLTGEIEGLPDRDLILPYQEKLTNPAQTYEEVKVGNLGGFYTYRAVLENAASIEEFRKALLKANQDIEDEINNLARNFAKSYSSVHGLAYVLSFTPDDPSSFFVFKGGENKVDTYLTHLAESIKEKAGDKASTNSVTPIITPQEARNYADKGFLPQEIINKDEVELEGQKNLNFTNQLATQLFKVNTPDKNKIDYYYEAFEDCRQDELSEEDENSLNLYANSISKVDRVLGQIDQDKNFATEDITRTDYEKEIKTIDEALGRKNIAPATIELRKLVDSLNEITSNEPEEGLRKKIIFNARSNFVAKMVNDEIEKSAKEFIENLPLADSLTDPEKAGLNSIVKGIDLDTERKELEAVISFIRLTNQGDEHAIDLINKLVDKTVENIAQNSQPGAHTYKDDKLEGGFIIKRKTEFTAFKDADFKNVIRERVNNALQSSIGYKLDTKIHDFKQKIRNHYTKEAGKLIFGNDILSLLDPTMPKFNRLITENEQFYQGFTFYDARIAYERGWNAADVSAKDYNDPENTAPLSEITIDYLIKQVREGQKNLADIQKYMDIHNSEGELKIYNQKAEIIEALEPESEEGKELRELIAKYCRPLTASDNEPEYRTPGDPIPISSVGTENKVVRAGSIPRGATLKTGAGNLNTGVYSTQAIIHAAPGSWTDNGNQEEKFFQEVSLAVKNALILAKRGGYRRLAVPFLGSAIFGGNSDRAKLARVVVNSAIQQSIKDNYEAVKEAKTKHNKIELRRFDNIKDFSGEVDAIISAANTRVVSPGDGGIAEAIQTASGIRETLIREKNGIIGKFNTAIEEINRGGRQGDNTLTVALNNFFNSFPAGRSLDAAQRETETILRLDPTLVDFKLLEKVIETTEIIEAVPLTIVDTPDYDGLATLYSTGAGRPNIEQKIEEVANHPDYNNLPAEPEGDEGGNPQQPQQTTGGGGGGGTPQRTPNTATATTTTPEANPVFTFTPSGPSSSSPSGSNSGDSGPSTSPTSPVSSPGGSGGGGGYSGGGSVSSGGGGGYSGGGGGSSSPTTSSPASEPRPSSSSSTPSAPKPVVTSPSASTPEQKLNEQTIEQYVSQQGLTNWSYDSQELEKLTTSQAVAQHVEQVTARARQQKLKLNILVEIGEFANELRSFKIWAKKAKVEENKVKEELIDCLCFFLGLVNLYQIDFLTVASIPFPKTEFNDLGQLKKNEVMNDLLMDFFAKTYHLALVEKAELYPYQVKLTPVQLKTYREW